ncbi:MAG: translation initiation factor IF-2, partial [Candidatus Udaeobacter sp.]
MATKTSSKTATRKAAPSAAGRKTTAPEKPADVTPKAKLAKKGAAAPTETTAALTQENQPEQAAPHPETVSLIDRKRPAKKSQEGEAKTKRTVLPPISRIRASLEATSKPPPAQVPSPEPPPPEPAEPSPAEAPPTAAEVEAGPQQKVLLMKPPIVVKHFANELALKPHQLIAELMTHNIFANINQTIEPDIAAKIAEHHGFILEKERREKGGGVHKVEQQVVAPPPPVIEKKEELKPRAPIITFMGHVDHGKTSLLDAIRKTRVAAGEAGGITQHIGAYSVDHNGHKITFIDTPGHAAFTAMRARGANVTDIVVLVIAADDGIMPQTVEAINHAKAAPHVKIMVAANKVDLPGANLDRLKKQLQERGLTPEDWGGETIVCPVSATKGTGIDQLLEMMSLQAEVMELKASPTARPRGTVIEAQVEAGRGPTATVIVQMGTLKIGDPFICGNYSGKVKSLLDDRGKPVKQVGPSTPVKVLGFIGLPNAGDEFLVMESERATKQLS